MLSYVPDDWYTCKRKYLIWRMLILIYAPDDWYTCTCTHRSESPSTKFRELLLLTMNGKKSQENARNHAVSSPAACFNKQNLGNLFCLHIFRRHSPLGSRNRRQSRSAHSLGRHACPPPDTDRKNLLDRSRCSPVVNITENGIAVFQHGRPGFMRTRHRYSVLLWSTPEEWSSCQLQPEKVNYGKGGGFRGRGTLRAGCSADTHWSVPLVKKVGG